MKTQGSAQDNESQCRVFVYMNRNICKMKIIVAILKFLDTIIYSET
jgi:hypothetical protein